MIRTSLAALQQKRASLDEKQKGFTLIELLVVVLIIGVLAAVAIPIFLGQQATARDNAAMAQVTNAKTAVVAMLVEGGDIPADEDAITGFTASADIPVTVTQNVAGDAFCLSAAHVDGDNTFVISDTSAAAEGTCTAGVATFS